MYSVGRAVSAAMNFFTSSVNTLCNKTMEDTLQTVKQYETARSAHTTFTSHLHLSPSKTRFRPSNTYDGPTWDDT